MAQRANHTRHTTPLPVTPAPERLPLNDANFSWQQFEAFCRDLISRQPGVVDCHHYGKLGSKQRGVDLVATVEDGEHWVFQCKQRKQFSKAQAEKAIQASTYKADRHYLVVNCEFGTGVRDACRTAVWYCWDVRDLSQQVRQLEPETARRLVELHFGAAWREAFLGIGGPAAFLLPDEFFLPWTNPTHLFNHAWQLVGRKGVLDALDSFVDDIGRVAILTGRGGIGKSKILLAFAAQFLDRHAGWQLYFLDPGLSPNPEALDELPLKPCVVVVDDAHGRLDDLSGLFASSCRRTFPIKLVLSCRPYSKSMLLGGLTRAGYGCNDVAELSELRELELADVADLARQALGPEFEGYAEALAGLTRDCPLVTVVGGKLIAEKHIAPLLLEHNAEFQFTVLNRFEDLIVGETLQSLPPRETRALLRVIAAVSPLREDNQDVIEAGAQFLSLAPAAVREALGELEAGGALLRRGRTLRITPDVLADHILNRACLTPQGKATGYAHDIFVAFARICPAEILRNLAELDWRVHRSGETAPDALDEVWRDIAEEFEAGSNYSRCAILNHLAGVAFFQPARMLSLVETAVHSPSQTPASDPIGPIAYGHHDVLQRRMDLLGQRGEHPCIAYSHHHVLQQLPPILREIGFNLEHLPYCLDLLWELARDEDPEMNQSFNGAFRILQDLAGYDLDKPFVVNRCVLQAIERWLHLPGAHDHRNSPLDLVGPLLRKEGDSNSVRGDRMQTTSFFVPQQATQEIREKALHLLAECASYPSIRVVLNAIHVLSDELVPPMGRFHMVATEEVVAQWLPERLAVLDLLRSILERASNPLIQLKVADSVASYARLDATPEISSRASEILAAVPNTFESRLCRALISIQEFGWLQEEGEGQQEAFQRHSTEVGAKLAALALEFLVQFPDARAGSAALRERMEAIQSVAVQVSAGQFLGKLAESDTGYTAEICNAIIDEPVGALARYLPSFLGTIRSQDEEVAFQVAQRALQTGSVDLCRSVADVYSSPEWETAPDPLVVAMLSDLAQHEDAGVRSHIIRAVRALNRFHPAIAIPLALKIDIRDNCELAAGLCMTFVDALRVPFDSLGSDVIDCLLEKLKLIRDVNDPFVGEFLVQATVRRPRSVLSLLLGRIEIAATVGPPHYWPLPADAFDYTPTGIEDHSEYEAVLREVRDAVLPGSWQAREWVPSLFRYFSCGYKSPSLAVLEEWIHSGDPLYIELAVCLASAAPKDFVFNNQQFVVSLLREANRAGPDCYDRVTFYLFKSTANDGFSTVLGQPAPEHVSQHDRAKAIATGLAAGSPEHRFYDALAKEAREVIEHFEALYDETE